MTDWCIRFAGVSPQEIPFAVSELSAAIYGYTRRLPAVGTGDGEASSVLLALGGEGVPENGYRVTVGEVQKGRQQVTIRGFDAYALQCGCMDFCGRYLSQAALSRRTANPYYFKALFGEDALPAADFASAPRIGRRGLWTWGRAIYNYRGYLENMARLRLNELIVWNDFAPVNGREIASYAHELGIKLIWGYAWGWDTTMRLDTSVEASRRIIDTYEREYAPLGGDGIYFQSFTETSREFLDGVLIADAAVKFVNRTAGALLKKHPDLRLLFGLHADSVKNRLEIIAKTDPRVEIIWENCGGFPYHSCPDVLGDAGETRAFTERLLALRPGAGTGAVLKSMIQLDWGRFRHQAGPNVLGCAGEEAIASRLPSVRKIWRYIAGEWLDHGERAGEILRLYAEKKDASVYCLVEDGLFEKEIPLPAALFADLAWDPFCDWKTLVRQTVQRSDLSLG